MPPTQYLSLVDSMARMSLRADASKYYLGYIWWILEPLLYVLVFYVVFNVILDSKRADFLIFLMCGKLPFIWFSKSVTQASNSIVGNKGLIGKINITKTLFPMAIVQEGLYKQVAVFALLIAVLIFYGYSVSVTWLWLIPVIIVNYLMIVACSLVGAALVCVVRDFSMLISLGMIFLMFTSGLFWDVHALADPEMTSLVLTFNPLAFILDCYRQIFMYQATPDLSHLAILGIGWLLLLAAIVWAINRSGQYLALKAMTA
ncbi:MAG: lipopolysaccharide transport system permease protein [Halieaceae bacterium]|jgi:lipopolysaccharide transport system permease protein